MSVSLCRFLVAALVALSLCPLAIGQPATGRRPDTQADGQLIAREALRLGMAIAPGDAGRQLYAAAVAVDLRLRPGDPGGRERVEALLKPERPKLYTDPTYGRTLRALLQRAADDPQIRVIGGAVEQGHPECVSIGNANNRTCCSGVVWSARCVLTAGHCASTCDMKAVYFGTNASDGPYNVIGSLRHPSDQAYEDDLLVLYVDRDLPVGPPELSLASSVDRADIVKVVGYGLDDNKSKGLRQSVGVSLVCKLCDDAGHKEYDCFVDKEYVAKQAGKDACEFDSGGPAYVEAPSKTDSSLTVWTLSGIVSRGVKQECGYGTNYVRLDQNHYIDWVNKACAELGAAAAKQAAPDPPKPPDQPRTELDVVPLGVRLGDLPESRRIALQLPQNVRGVEVLRAEAGGVGQKAGITAGIVIESVDSHPVAIDSIVEVVRRAWSGDSEVLVGTWARDHGPWESRVVRVREKVRRPEPSAARGTTIDALGVTVKDVTEARRQELKLPAEVNGVEVVELQAGGLAAKVGVLTGQILETINDEHVTAATLADRLSQLVVARKPVTAVIWRSQGGDWKKGSAAFKLR